MGVNLCGFSQGRKNCPKSQLPQVPKVPQPRRLTVNRDGDADTGPASGQYTFPFLSAAAATAQRRCGCDGQTTAGTLVTRRPRWFTDTARAAGALPAARVRLPAEVVAHTGRARVASAAMEGWNECRHLVGLRTAGSSGLKIFLLFIDEISARIRWGDQDCAIGSAQL